PLSTLFPYTTLFRSVSQGIKMLSGVISTSPENSMIIACSVGMGLGVTVVPELFAQLPESVQILTSNGIVAGSITAIGLNIVFNIEEQRLNSIYLAAVLFLSKNNRFIILHNNAVFQMPFYSPSKHTALYFTADFFQVYDMITVVYSLNILLNNRPFIEIIRYIMGCRSD